MRKKICGLNGFGRFGLHLLRYWLININVSKFVINYINDDTLSIHQIYNIIRNDKYVTFKDFKIQKKSNLLLIFKKEKKKKIAEIIVTKNNQKEISWLGEPDIFFECSGKNTKKKDCKFFIKKNTKLIIISATSYDCDQTLIYGFNHEKYRKSSTIISYGSCTVDAYIPLAHWINKNFRVSSSDLNIIHNTPDYKIKKYGKDSIAVHSCTLKTAGPKLLYFLNKNNFHINYTLIPFSGVSIIDFRFKIKKKITKKNFINSIRREISKYSLKSLYSLEKKDKHPNFFKLSRNSANLIEESIKLKKHNIYIHGYFDNENSANRYFDLVNFICKKNN